MCFPAAAARIAREMTLSIVLEGPHAVSLEQTVRSHGWYLLAPWSWDDARKALSRPERLPSGSTAVVEATQHGPGSVLVTVEGRRIGREDVEAARGRVARWLSTDWDPAPAIETAARADPNAADAIRRGHGRFLRGSTFYEDFAKTVCTIQISWSGTLRMARALVDSFGGGTFPTPREIIDAGESGLREVARLGFRAPQLLASTERLLAGGLMDEDGNGAEERITYDELMELPGIGPYAASHIAMLLHDYSRIPVDSAVTSFFRGRYGLGPAQIEPYFDGWGDFRFLGYRFSAR